MKNIAIGGEPAIVADRSRRLSARRLCNNAISVNTSKLWIKRSY